MIHQIANLTIIQLDYAIALTEGYKFGAPMRLPNAHFYRFPLSKPGWKTLGAVALHSDGWGENVPKFCTGPAGDEIIDRDRIAVVPMFDEAFNTWYWKAWVAMMGLNMVPVNPSYGATRRIAAMRARAAFVLGEEIEIHEVIK